MFQAARARSHRAVLAAPSGSDGCPLRSLSLVADALHCKRATACTDAPRALVTPAGCACRRRDRGATPQFWVKGLPPKNGAQWERSQNRRPAARAEAGRRRITMSERNLVETLRELGPEKVVDGSELCPCCDGLSPGISADGETIVHCPVCHDRNVVTVEDADRWRNEMRKQHG